MKKDTYKTISKPSKEVLFKDRNSKFFGYAYPVTSEEQISNFIRQLKKSHYNALHWCYAWQLGKEYEKYRANDDGEPSNSAGKPIYGQLQSFELTNVLVVVVRYFGGTKLGVGGLIQAYKTTAKMALGNSEISVKSINESFVLNFEYADMNVVMRIIKDDNLTIKDQVLELSCKIIISVRKKDAARIFDVFSNTYKISIKRKED